MNKRKRLLIDVGHPGELHHYRHLYAEMKIRGWRGLFVAKDKDVIISLLQAYHLPFVVLATNKGGLINKIFHLPADLVRFYGILKRYRPDLVISPVSLHASWISAWRRVPHIAFIDTEPRGLVDTLTLPFIQAKITAHSYYRDLKKNHFRYSGNHELCYLHPARFTADPAVKKELGLAGGESYVIVRFVAWKAFHDAGLPHMTDAERMQLVDAIRSHKRVFISSEAPLSAAFQPYAFPLPPQRMLDALAFADLYVGEGITMAAEAATLGTAAVLLNFIRMGYCIEAEKHGMLFSYPEFSNTALEKIRQLVSTPEIKSVFRQNYRGFMADKIDVTAFMAWFVERYPESKKVLEQNPDFPRRFLV